MDSKITSITKFLVVLSGILCFYLSNGKAQTAANAVFFIDGGTVYTATGSLIHVNGGLANDAGNLENNGLLTLKNSTATTTGSIYLETGSTTSGNGTYEVEQDWVNSASFNAGTSEVIMNSGSNSQFITGTSSTTFNNLTLTAGTPKVNQTITTTVSGFLVLNDRELATADNLLIVTNPVLNAVTNNNVAGSEGFVSSDFAATGLGALIRATNTNQKYLYPVGSSFGTKRYRPVEITPVSSNINSYSVRMANSDASLENFDRNLSDSTVCSPNNLFFHRIDRTSGTDAADISIYYSPADDGQKEGIAQWNAPGTNQWNGMGTVSTGTNGVYSTMTKAAVNSFGSTTTPFILYEPKPSAPTLAGNNLLCSGSGAYVYTASGNSNSTYTWSVNGGTIVSTPSNAQTVSIDWGMISPGSITVIEQISGGNCASNPSTAFTVNITPSPVAGFDTTSSGPFSQMVSFTDTSSNATSWSWNFGDGNTSEQQNPSNNYYNSGNYTVQLITTNNEGCADTVSTEVTIVEGVIIPNVFSPNGDGQNDWFYIANTGLGEYSIEIYNRWGTKIWEATAPEIRWDGRTTSGQLLSEGTYFYLLKAIGKGNAKDYSTNGTVTLFR